MIDPRIGQLMRNGKVVHYAMVNGYGKPPVEGTQKEVEAALGLHVAPVVKPAANKVARSYTITVTPKTDYWVGTTKMGQYEVEVCGLTAADAIKISRQTRRDEEGRFAVPATFTAKLSA